MLFLLNGAALFAEARRAPVPQVTQLLTLPLLWWYRSPQSEWAFTFCFAMYMLLDFALVKLDALITAHHLFCLLGHVIVCGFMPPPAFAVYFNGVVALELGSGCMNVFLLRPTSWRVALYAIGMTASNAAAAALALEWVRLEIPIAPKVLNIAITVVMVVLRQKSCVKWIRGGPASFTHPHED